jgi:hypothetical protein
MLKSYEAIYDHGHITWLHDAPQTERSRVIITLVSALSATTVTVNRAPSQLIAGKGATFADLIDPIVPEKDWECLA